MKKILVTGALGQIGSELVMTLRERYGNHAVIASDIRKIDHEVCETGPFEIMDVTDQERFLAVSQSYEVDTIIHLAALLSARAEHDPLFAWNLNMTGLLNGLEVARICETQFFTPSSIGAFGPSTPKEHTPQLTVQRPVTMYGVNKVAGELLCDYYFHKFGVDTRSVRFPGLISSTCEPGGGTTDYAVNIFYGAILDGAFVSNLSAGTFLDMMYMPDAVQAIIDLMEADGHRLVHRNAYNISAMSVDPEMLAAEIREHIPNFSLTYHVDETLQGIADSWPNEMDCSSAAVEWGFAPTYNVETMTMHMLKEIEVKLNMIGN